MTIVDTINAVHARLVRNKRIRLALHCGVAASYAALLVALVGTLSRPLGWTTGIALLATIVYRMNRRGLLAPPTIEEAGAVIDRAFVTKDRALTLAATWGESGDAEKKLLARQLNALVPEFDVAAIVPCTLDPILKRALATVPLVWGLVWYLGSPRSTPSGSAEGQAAIISELLEQRTDIPLPVRQSLLELQNTLETKPLTDQAVIEALQAAQAEIDQANESLDEGAGDSTGDTIDDSEATEGTPGGDIAEESPNDIAPVGSNPTPTPEPTPTAAAGATEPPPPPSQNEEQQQAEEKKDSAEQKKEEQENGSSNDTDVQNSKSSNQQGGSEKQPSQSKNDGGEGGSKSEQQQSGNQQGESQGQQGQEGDGDGASSSKQGKKPGTSGGQSGAQGQAGQQGAQQGSGEEKSDQGGEKNSGAKGNRAGDKTSTGQDSGLEQAQEALNKIEQELKAQQQGDEKGDQQGEKDGGEKGNTGESDSGKPSGAGGKKQGQGDKKQGAGQGQQGDKNQVNEQGKSKQDKKEQGGTGGGKDRQGGKPNDVRPESGSAGDNEPKEEFGEAPKLPVGSSLPKESDAAMGPGDENGGLGQGLGDRKGFKDTEIRAGDEKYDSRFTGKDGKVGLNKGPARTKTNLEDVKLAKPDPVKDPTEQPIPLEYRDILE